MSRASAAKARGAGALAPNGAASGGLTYKYVGQRGRAALLRYNYSCVDRSIIAPYLQPFWTRLVSFVPLWVAPNCITVAGLALVCVSFVLAWAHSPQLDQPTPVWLLLTHAALVFWDQTLDARDGKQAREQPCARAASAACLRRSAPCALR